jgi:hypothetical protein
VLIQQRDSGLSVAVVPAYLDDNTDAEAHSLARTDAAFIVEACNAYDALRKERDALRDVVKDVLACNDCDPCPGLQKDAHEALALCEKEGE